MVGVFGEGLRQELMNMLITHVEEIQSLLAINVRGTKTDKKRVFTIAEEDEINSLKLIKVLKNNYT